MSCYFNVIKNPLLEEKPVRVKTDVNWFWVQRFKVQGLQIVVQGFGFRCNSGIIRYSTFFWASPADEDVHELF